MNYTNM